MSGYTTVSVKIPKRLRERMRTLDIAPSKILREAIENEIRRREVQRIKKEIKALKTTLDKIPLEEVAKGIRQDRNSR